MHVILGITGGIAAYKSASLLRLLTEAGHSVKVLPTQNALRFIGQTTLEALSHNTVDSDIYTDVADVKHINLAQEAELIIVAPATAAFLGRYANGISDDLLSNVLLASNAPVVVAPAMHTEMWNHASTAQNVETLKLRGVHVLEPATGRLTGNDSGAGRMPEPEEIINQALQVVGRRDLEGKSILVTAGGTHENIDAVRFIGNKSSGKQGVAIAQAASLRGADVTLIAANVNLPLPNGVKVVRVESASQLNDAVLTAVRDSDCLVMAAAVSDYRVQDISEGKLKKSDLGESFNLQLVLNSDTLADAVKAISKEGLGTLTVGFAAETAGSIQNLEDVARAKLASKGCDVIVANDVSNGAVFSSDSNEVLILTRTGGAFSASGTKLSVAGQLLDVISDMLA